MAKRIKISLNDASSIDRAISALKQYKIELQNKAIMFVSELAQVGIETAKVNCGEYGDRISFSRSTKLTPDGAEGKLIAVGSKIAGFRGKDIVYADALLLAEFGSGWEAEVLDDVPGLVVGQATFPGQIHASDPDGWWYLGADGEYHHTMGVVPTHPMHSAMIAMVFDFQKVARKVFRS